jgi:hypothetical protein
VRARTPRPRSPASRRAGKRVLILQYHAAKEGHFETQVTADCDGDVSSFVVTGNIMGVGMGTPALRDGVHVVARDPVSDADSDADLSLPTFDRLGTVRGRKKRSGLVCFDDEA